MSRTDKTAPPWVKVFYYPDWIEEYHDHTTGPCDLPPRPTHPKDPGTDYQMWYGGRRDDDETRCYWTASYSQYYTQGISRCCCPMCHRYAYEPDPNRARRRKDRRYCKDGWRDEY